MGRPNLEARTDQQNPNHVADDDDDENSEKDIYI
jgi:hypothetical protein